jgi:iron complex outermembrane recepter protein
LIRQIALLSGLVVVGMVMPLLGQTAGLAQMSLEELMDIEVTTVARKKQPLLAAAASVAVLTAEDIRRSGARTLPDALRLVPGVHVARIDGSKWSVTARGFGGQFANKLLVLIDGRSVYTPLFGGVFWDLQDLLMEDVERIEVIRGPGAVQWGANAVNGVINVITNPASALQDNLLAARGGYRSEVVGAHGGRRGSTSYRLYGKFFDTPAGTDSSGIRSADTQRMWRGGVRLDGGSDRSQLMLQAGLYGGETTQTFHEAAYSLLPPYRRTFATQTDLGGGHVLGRWTTNAVAGEAQIQVSADHTRRRDDVDIRENRTTVDVDVQHRLPLGRNELVWGLGYRVTRDELDSTFVLRVAEPRRIDVLLSLFAHDEIDLLHERLRLSLGLKVEHNPYTGMEVQPDARLLWLPRPGHAVWLAASRAVRTPARGESEQSLTVEVLPPNELIATNLPIRIAIENDDPVKPDKLRALELGWRADLNTTMQVGLAGYVHRYDDVMTYRFGQPYTRIDGPVAHNVLPLHLNNAMKGQAMGAELSLDWQPVNHWRLRGSYSLFDANMDNPNPRLALAAEQGDPRRMATLWSSLDLPKSVQLDVLGRHVGEMPHHGVGSYTDVDLRLGWRWHHGVSLSAGGRNILGPAHREHQSGFHNLLPTRQSRSLFVEALWRSGSTN